MFHDSSLMIEIEERDGCLIVSCQPPSLNMKVFCSMGSVVERDM